MNFAGYLGYLACTFAGGAIYAERKSERWTALVLAATALILALVLSS